VNTNSAAEFRNKVQSCGTEDAKIFYCYRLIIIIIAMFITLVARRCFTYSGSSADRARTVQASVTPLHVAYNNPIPGSRALPELIRCFLSRTFRCNLSDNSHYLINFLFQVIVITDRQITMEVCIFGCILFTITTAIMLTMTKTMTTTTTTTTTMMISMSIE